MCPKKGGKKCGQNIFIQQKRILVDTLFDNKVRTVVLQALYDATRDIYRYQHLRAISVNPDYVCIKATNIKAVVLGEASITR